MNEQLSLKNFLDESVEDKGIFKAVFMAGGPGSGKSYTMSQITSGTVAPRIVGFDIPFEFISKKHGIHYGDLPNDSPIVQQVKTTTKAQLFLYLNGVLPLYIDTTAGDRGRVMERVEVLKTLGYDVGMVFVHSDFETAQKRMAHRARKVPDQIAMDLYRRAQEGRNFYQSAFPFYREIDNNEGQLSNKVIMDAFKAVAGFYAQPIINPTGIETVKKLRETKQKYLVPAIYPPAYLHKLISIWYR